MGIPIFEQKKYAEYDPSHWHMMRIFLMQSKCTGDVTLVKLETKPSTFNLLCDGFLFINWQVTDGLMPKADAKSWLYVQYFSTSPGRPVQMWWKIPGKWYIECIMSCGSMQLWRTKRLAPRYSICSFNCASAARSWDRVTWIFYPTHHPNKRNCLKRNLKPWHWNIKPEMYTYSHVPWNVNKLAVDSV